MSSTPKNSNSCQINSRNFSLSQLTRDQETSNPYSIHQDLSSDHLTSQFGLILSEIQAFEDLSG